MLLLCYRTIHLQILIKKAPKLAKTASTEEVLRTASSTSSCLVLHSTPRPCGGGTAVIGGSEDFWEDVSWMHTEMLCVCCFIINQNSINMIVTVPVSPLYLAANQAFFWSYKGVNSVTASRKLMNTLNRPCRDQRGNQQKTDLAKAKIRPVETRQIRVNSAVWQAYVSKAENAKRDCSQLSNNHNQKRHPPLHDTATQRRLYCT